MAAMPRRNSKGQFVKERKREPERKMKASGKERERARRGARVVRRGR